MCWPVVLGGVPRKYLMVNGIASQEKLKKVQGFVELGLLKVTIDSRWDMEDVLKASLNWALARFTK